MGPELEIQYSNPICELDSLLSQKQFGCHRARVRLSQRGCLHAIVTKAPALSQTLLGARTMLRMQMTEGERGQEDQSSCFTEYLRLYQLEDETGSIMRVGVLWWLARDTPSDNTAAAGLLLHKDVASPTSAVPILS